MKIEWNVFATEDREEIFAYIEEDSPEAAVRVDVEIESQIEVLAVSPEIGRLGRVHGTRELVIVHTPFVVAYTISDQVVTILRVLHGARRWPSEF